MEWVREFAPSWPDVRGCRASGTRWHRDRAQRGCNRWTKRRMAASSPIREWLQAPDNGASRRSCCDVRDRKWRCQNRSNAHRSFSLGGNLSSTKENNCKKQVNFIVQQRRNERATIFSTCLFRIVRDIKLRVDKEDVLRFEVRVRQLVIVQETNGIRQLVANMTHLVQGVRLVVVVLL